MINKIERLISIGKFRNFQALGDIAFKKLTLIYGDNGGGKTTLTAILRSATQNRPEIIKLRQSTNETTAQAAQITQRSNTGNTHHTFHFSRGWTVPIPDIEIFDSHFVDENIHSGFDFTDDHKKQLHQFVIGAQGVAIQQQIEQNKIDKSTSKAAQTTLENQLIQSTGNELNSGLITAFLNIPVSQAANVDQQIIIAEASLASARSNAVIQTLQRLSQASTIVTNINLEELEQDLQLTTSAIQDAALKILFDNHCQDLTDNSIKAPEPWLKTGFSYLETKHQKSENGNPSDLNCPFCTQPLKNNLDVIKAYARQFNEEFNSLVLRLENHLNVIQAFNIENIIQTLNTLNKNNSDRINSWSVHLRATVHPPAFNIIENEASFRVELLALSNAIQQKLQNPSAALPIISLTNFRETIQSINSRIEIYNTSVRTYNAGISTFTSTIKSVNQAQEEVYRLRRIKKRFEAPISSLCTQLKAERQNLRSLEIAYIQLVTQQETAATLFFASYKDRINYYLENVFKTLFRIDNVVHVAPQGRATQSKISYKLTIDGKDISFDPNQSCNIKDCLSEGDKSTLALAFFLSKLDIDPGLNNKILIFDDPLSSFDSNRRMYTVQLIKDLFPQIKQVVVLSHNEFFLHEISKSFSPTDKKTLRISQNFITKASIIEPLILESLVENDYFKHVKELNNFLQNQDLDKKEYVLGVLRNVLEAHIRFKFYHQLMAIPANSQTFGTIITALVNQGVAFRDNANRTTIISKLNLLNGISCKPHHGEPIPDYIALGTDPSTINITELCHFVNDTLTLINIQL